MKTPIVLALSAICAASNVANAQTPKEAPARSIEDLLTRPPGVRLFATPGTAGFKSKLAVEIVQQDSGEVLRQLARVLGANIVIDPAIQFLPAKTRTLYLNDVKDDVFDYLSGYLIRSEAVEKWKSSAGTYFFAAKPFGQTFTLPSDYDSQARDFADREKKRADSTQGLYVLPRDSTQGLYIFPRIEIYPKGRFGRPIKPQPHWEKREFNGHEFYYIPAPANEEAKN